MSRMYLFQSVIRSKLFRSGTNRVIYKFWKKLRSTRSPAIFSLTAHPSLIIHYFSTKEEMIVAPVDYMLDMYEEAFLPRLQEIADPEEKLEAAIDAIFGMEWARLVDGGVLYACYSLSFRNPRVRESFQKTYSRLHEILVEETEDLMHKGAMVTGAAIPIDGGMTAGPGLGVIGPLYEKISS